MSLLMYALQSDTMFIVTDTLAVDVEGHPLVFTTKCGIVPHLEMAVAGTGIAQFADEWRHFLGTGVRAMDIESLNAFASTALRMTYLKYQADAGERSSTIYHFGWSNETDRYVAYAYRSADDFRSEPLQIGGFGVKPQPKTLEEPPASLADWIALAETIRAEQDELAAEERLYLGGELVAITLANRGISCHKIHRFADFRDQWNEMAERAGG